MGLANCKECGKLYVQNPAGICTDCYRIVEEQEGQVAAYLRDNQRASINEVHEATGVPEKVILKMIKKGRIVGDIALEYPCESCGKPITEGRVCAECGRRVLSQIKADPRSAQKPAEPPAPPKTGGGLHTTFTKR
jgi:rRNA maturation endonuclease Nob1